MKIKKLLLKFVEKNPKKIKFCNLTSHKHLKSFPEIHTMLHCKRQAKFFPHSNLHNIQMVKYQMTCNSCNIHIISHFRKTREQFKTITPQDYCEIEFPNIKLQIETILHNMNISNSRGQSPKAHIIRTVRALSWRHYTTKDINKNLLKAQKILKGS